MAKDLITRISLQLECDCMPSLRPKTPVKRIPSRVVKLPNRKIRRKVSPEQHFVRTGKIHPHINPKKAIALMERFLSQTWYEHAQAEKKEGRETFFPLPTPHQRLVGGRLTPKKINHIKEQVRFAVDVFSRDFSPSEQKRIHQAVLSRISRRHLSIRSALREHSKTDLKEMYKSGVEMREFFAGKVTLAGKQIRGSMYPAVMQDYTNRMYFAHGFEKHPEEKSGPMHEIIHVLQRIGVIKEDVPFAEAAQRVHARENGFMEAFKPGPRGDEFDRKPQINRHTKGAEKQREPAWSYETGDRLGDWVFRNLDGKKRWDYLFFRTKGFTHREALDKIK